MITQQDEGTPFNMAMLYYMQMNKDIISPKDEAIRQNDLYGWYYCLEALYHKIVFKIAKPKRELIEQKFTMAAKNLFQNVGGGRQASMWRSQAHPRARKILKELDVELTIIMDQNSMIFPNIKVQDGFERIRKKLGIKNGNSQKP